MALYSGKKTTKGGPRDGDFKGKSAADRTPRSQIDNPAIGKDSNRGTEPCKGKLG